ncbi:hypothetical protein PORY_000142 [Pneumocystis oryctolagi]|uniref:Uncharacterized protein n=1 Tax=Pneumocystis oryctolagi TaxID=42067 RepID=A0ACB7CJA9_9ASCO|nr:hypothetical protein PORY_000142 [Pneumocystis oryctolagi]
MGNSHSNLNKNDSVKKEDDIFKPFSPISSKSNSRPTRERHTDWSSIQMIVRYLFSNQDEFNHNFCTSINVDEKLLELSILITDRPEDFSNLEPHPLFKYTLNDLSMYISSKQHISKTPVFEIIPKILKLQPKVKSNASVDPLSDNLFHLNHKRFDRQEKHIRNIEREKFAHDRLYLEQKIDQLYGPDWKKVVMAISKITGSEDPLEIQRQFIIQRLERVLKKFDLWKEVELGNKRKSRKVADVNQYCDLKMNKTELSKDYLKKPKSNTKILKTHILKTFNDNESNFDQHVQKKRKTLTDFSDSKNNRIIRLLNTCENEASKDESVSIEDNLIKVENISIKNKNKSNKNQNMTIKNENKFIKNQSILNKKDNISKDKHTDIEDEKRKSKIMQSSIEDKKELSFIKSPHIRQAIANKWRRSNRTVLAFGQPLPKITMKVKEFSLPFEILKNEQK